MTTKKLVTIIVGAVVGMGLVVVLFAGAIVGFAFYSMSNSDAANTARTFLRQSEKLKEDIGEVKDFGSFITGSVNVRNSDGDARLNIKVIGSRKTVNASIDLTYRNGRAWQVTSASYTNDQGQLVELQNPFNSKLIIIPLAA